MRQRGVALLVMLAIIVPGTSITRNPLPTTALVSVGSQPQEHPGVRPLAGARNLEGEPAGRVRR
jgi:hypothetical protein